MIKITRAGSQPAQKVPRLFCVGLIVLLYSEVFPFLLFVFLLVFSPVRFSHIDLLTSIKGPHCALLVFV